MPRAPVIALTHGGGPMPLLGDPNHKDIVRSLKERVPALLKLGTSDAPRAIALVTAHWSEDQPSISNGSQHDLLYDYYGFPKESYNLKYPAPGHPQVAKEIAAAFRDEGLNPRLDDKRGWDHGVLSSEKPEDHFAMGRALGKLRESNVAVVGSGFASIHNIRAMLDGSTRSPGFVGRNKAWSRSLGDALAEESLATREKRLSAWREYPNSFEMHPRNGGEHFMPLLVCAGAAGDGKMESYADQVFGLDVWSYYWV